MRYFILVFIFCFSAAQAQYEQVVKPVQVDEVVNFTQYQLRQALNQFFKTSSSSVLLSSTRLALQAAFPCLNPETAGADIELSITRSSSSLEDQALQIRESLFLNACGQRRELYTVARKGKDITPTADIKLLRGDIPDAKNLEFYSLELMERAIKIEIMQEQTQQKMNLSILFSINYEMQVQILESFAEQTLINQYIRTVFFEKGIVVDDFDGEYKWILDARYKVPRQYLYFRQQEVPPGEFLKKKNSLFNQNIFPLIQSGVQFASKPM